MCPKSHLFMSCLCIFTNLLFLILIFYFALNQSSVSGYNWIIMAVVLSVIGHVPSPPNKSTQPGRHTPTSASIMYHLRIGGLCRSSVKTRSMGGAIPIATTIGRCRSFGRYPVVVKPPKSWILCAWSVYGRTRQLIVSR